MSENGFDYAVSRLSENVCDVLSKVDTYFKEKTFEVRLRSGQPPQICGEYGNGFVCRNSNVVIDYKKCDLLINTYEIKESLNKICDYSLHTHLCELQNGFVTLKGGHRVGIGATAVLNEGGIYNLRDISSLNIRIAHQVFGASDIIPDYITFSQRSLIVFGPPLSGKTTVLRDIARRLSQSGKRVVVIDERNEISAISNGECGNDLGPSCDVLNLFPKDMGIMTALRTLSPEVIVCDEIGNTKETDFIIEGLNSGVRFLISVHASDFESLKNKPQFKKLISSKEFSFAVFLNNKKAEIMSL